MKTKIIMVVAATMYLLLASNVYATVIDSRVIPIVVLDLRATGGLDADDVVSINEYLRGQISALPNYRVVEQSQLAEIMKTFEQQQLSGMYDLSTTTERLAFTGAQQVILGSVGVLFDRVVLSVRLVEMATGEIVFSYTAHAPLINVFDRMDEIVQRLREYALLRFQVITVDDIESLVNRKRYAEAQERLEAFYRQQRREESPPDETARILPLQQRINENLYTDYLRQARRARRRNDYLEARRLITRAIAIQPTSEALEERDRIQIAEEAYQRDLERQRRLIEMRAEEEERRELAGVYLSPWEAVSAYYQSISLTGRRLALSTTVQMNRDLDLPEERGSLGLVYLQTFSLFDRPVQRMIDSRSIAAAGISLDYDDSGDDAFMHFKAHLSPHTGAAFKIFNLVLSLGIDGGVLVGFGNRYGSAPQVFPTAGAYATGDFMIRDRRGFHLGGRLDYAHGAEEEEPGQDPLSAWFIRIFAGVTL